MRSISIDQARRYALAAQGFTEPRPSGRVDVRHFRRVLDRVLVVQLDSVNVFSRTHYMPFFSRLGAYDHAALDQWLWRSGEMFEYWGHMASVLPVADHRLFRWRMERGFSWDRMEQLIADRPGYLEGVLDEVRRRGPLQTSDLDDPGEKGDRTINPMWNWSHGKVALEMLFVQGKLAAADRRNFVRIYDLAERVIPPADFDAAALPKEEAQSILLERSARALGVGTADDVADYYRIRMPEARPLVKRLVAEGRLIEVAVRGWDKPALLHPEAMLPRSVQGRALL
ncbi:MAG: winged helix DNA-binding domain-containing protein, partial [Actinomycetota bacterium]|nr:winged helix DNA-binding domain-containing protein [Actinomycetota bacterium]